MRSALLLSAYILGNAIRPELCESLGIIVNVAIVVWIAVFFIMDWNEYKYKK